MEPNRIATRRRRPKAVNLAALAGAGALAAYSLLRRDKLSIPLASGAGLLVWQGMHGMGRQRTHYQTSLTINQPVEEVYRYWRNLQNLPLFMSHLEAVCVTGERRSEWKARGPMGSTIRWEAEICDEKPNQWLVWRSLPGADMRSVGSVQFRPAPGNRGTEITVALEYEPVGGNAGRIVAAMLGRDPERTIKEDLRNFKHIMEAGEIPTTKGQPSGRRSAMVELLEAVAPDYRNSGTALRTA